MSDLTELAKPVIDKVSATGWSLMSVGTAWAWIGDNHQQLTVAIAIVGLCITAYGVFRSKD